MVQTSAKEGKEKGILLYRQILTVKEYRTLAQINDITGRTLAHLKEQIAEPTGPGKEFWWCPVTDLELLQIRAIDEPIKVAIVTDGKSAIICELPSNIQKEHFVKVD